MKYYHIQSKIIGQEVHTWWIITISQGEAIEIKIVSYILAPSTACY